MLTRILRLLRRDEGLSLLEVLVAMALLGVVLTATASLMITGLVSANRAEAHTRANALANELLENLKAVPWTQVATQPGSPTTQCQPTGQPYDTCVLERDGTTYRVAVSTAWDTTPVVGYSQSETYRRLRVDLAWESRNQPYALRVESLRAPPASQNVVFVVRGYDALPSIVYIDSSGVIDHSHPYEDMDGTPVSPVWLTLETNVSVTTVVVRYRDRNGTLHSPGLTNPSGDRKNWQLQIPSTAFPNGDTVFAFEVTRSLAGGALDVVNVDKLVRFIQPVGEPEVTFTPASPFTVDGCAGAPDVVTVDITLEGFVVDDDMAIGWSPDDMARADFVASSLSGATFRGTLAFPGEGVHTLYLDALRAAPPHDHVTTTRTYEVVVPETGGPVVC
jgi:prepilin-type N-terminal cleavage/methylation domain-containing protein